MMGAILLPAGLVACGTQEGDPSEVVALRNPLYYLSSKLWPQRDIPVCWTAAGNDTEKAWVKQALRGQRSWSEAANLNFTGWGSCGSGSAIKITEGPDAGASFRSASGVSNMTLDFRVAPQSVYSVCANNALSREQCIKTVALHEFGHSLGYAHEHDRSDTPASCTSAPDGDKGDTTFGIWDGRAIMAYCDFTTQLSPLERRGTDRLYRQAYVDSDRLGDFNGDGRDDLLCHDVINGDKSIDLADAGGQYAGTDWSGAVNFCDHDTARLFKGDFNGDGKTDLLCHDVATGTNWVDFADSAGHFGGVDWTIALNWCNHANGRVFVGDFNGDGRDDLLCHDTADGRKWIDYADSAGHFGGTDWSTGGNFCSHATGRLHIGDFNGDGRDDMLCHDVADGRKWIDFADASGRFGGTDWSSTFAWCNHDTAELHVGDFNGDGKADLLCHDVGDGTKWIDFADSAGHFAGSDWSAALGWCYHNAARLFVGDANGDGRDDLVCHDIADGSKWVDFADAAGQFGGTDWSAIAGQWCAQDSNELH